MKQYLLIALIMLVATGLACSLNLDLPRIETGPTETFTIAESLPAEDTTSNVTVNMGAGHLNLTGGATGLAEGTIQYNVAEWKPTVSRAGNDLTIRQGLRDGIEGIPGDDVVNDWSLKLGDAPLNLTIKAGAYDGTLDLSGLPLRNLSLSNGASQAEVTFNSVNPIEMDKLFYQTGASKINLTGLANANFSEMIFNGGAGNYTLDFSDQLQRDATVTITSGISNMTLMIPSETAATVSVSAGLNHISTTGPWTTSGSIYKIDGTDPTLTVNIELGAGNLTLVSQ